MKRVIIFSSFLLIFATLFLLVISVFINSLKVNPKVLEQSVKLLLGLATILTLTWTIFSYFHTKKLEYTSKDRREWRSSLRKVLITLRENDLEKGGKRHQKCKSIVLANLNPLPSDNSIDKKVLDIFKNDTSISKQVSALENLLKFDWERAKLATGFRSNKLKSLEIELKNNIK